jgi:hypothetical protein
VDRPARASYYNLPLDVIEAMTYGREWQLGYDKLPPVPWFLGEIAYRLTGLDASLYALSQGAGRLGDDPIEVQLGMVWR